MSDENPYARGCGRGGRGALIKEAIEKSQRRQVPLPVVAEKPKETRVLEAASPLDTSLPSTSSPKETDSGSDSGAVTPKGRALLLGRGISIPSSASSSTSSGLTSVGRSGLLLAGRGSSLLPDSGRGSVLSAALSRGSALVSPTTGDSSRSETPSTSQVSLPIQDLVIDQPRGTDGKPCKLQVNYVRLRTKPGMGVFEYHVNFNPPIDSVKLRYKIMKSDEVRAVTGQTCSFDGAKLCLPFKLPNLMTEVTSTLPTDNSSVMIHIKFVGQAAQLNLIQHYNVLMRKIMYKLKMTLVGRNYFDHRGGIEVPQHKLEVWPGYVTAIQEYDDGLMLNCDASFRVLQTVTAFDLLKECLKVKRDTFREEFAKKVIGCIVLTRYNNNSYRIDDVQWDKSPSDSFKFRSGEEITYVNYYKNNYDITIKDPNQPLLIHNDKPRGRDKDASKPSEGKMICLIPELCYMTGLTDDMRSDFKVMRDIAVHTRVSPNQRQLCLQKYIDNVNGTPEAKEVLSSWGLELDTKPMSVNGRQLNSEMIAVGRGVKFQANREADWGREMGREHVLNPIPLRKWVIIYTKRDSGKAQDFSRMMLNVLPQMGVQGAVADMRELANDRTETYLKVAREAVDPSVQLLVFIMPTPRDDRYNAVKKLCCIEMPIASQVINARTIAQPQKLRSVTQKIALQVNCKLGGELWAVNVPLQKTMICGCDVYHDPSRKGKSVVGFVSSLNNSYTRWYNVAAFQDAGQELVDCLRIALLSSLKKYDEINHFLPDKIILFRDGVGEGQLRMVRDYEVDQLKKAFEHFNGGYNPALVVIIVSKRINTRLFLDLQGNKGLENPPPGTVLDHTVNKKNWFDFFLISQHVRQGTVSPSHYIVVHNQSQLKADHLQKLAYKMTHMYYNWPGTVRVPAPCQYAHKLAYLCGQNIHNPASVALCERLFFL